MSRSIVNIDHPQEVASLVAGKMRPIWFVSASVASIKLSRIISFFSCLRTFSRATFFRNNSTFLSAKD
jgi:hypothetical protein